ncbi:MAG: Gfo/Idh/MocA family oxidoreductase [bacterium]
METIGIGIIGSGFMGRTHSEAFTKYVDGASVRAVAGGSRAPALAKEYGIDCEATPEDLVARSDVDAVVVATPHNFHAAHALLAMNAKKHVLLEKPVGATLEDCRRLEKALRESGVICQVAFTQRYRKANETAKEIIEFGRIGKVLQILEMQHDWHGLEGLPPWQSQTGNLGTLFGHGCHSIDRVRWFTGKEIETVYAHCSPSLTGAPVETMSMVMMVLSGGAVANFWCCWESPKPCFPHSAFRARILGERGLLDVDAYGKMQLGIDDKWETVFEQPPLDFRGDYLAPVRMESFGRQDQAFVDSIRAGKQPGADLRSGLVAAYVAFAAELSSRERRAVSLGEMEGEK